MLSQFFFRHLYVIGSLACVLASDDALNAPLTDRRLDKFFSTRTDQLQREGSENKAKQHQTKKQINLDERNSMSAHNIDSRYPDFISKQKKKPALIRELDHAALSGARLHSVNVNAEIVSPVSPPRKQMSLPPNFSRPLPSADRYESVTENILQNYL